MDISRRRVLQLLGLSVAALSAPPVFNALAGESKEPAAGPGLGGRTLKARRWGLVIDSREFKSEADVAPLVIACHATHNVPHWDEKRWEVKWMWPESYDHAFPEIATDRFADGDLAQRSFPVLCNHCENPPCVRACPTEATFKRPTDGIVMMDYHRCIGCRFCMAACPFGARSFNYRDPRFALEQIDPKYPTRTKGVVEKCNFCADRLAEGERPACVEASNGKLAFGDLDDEKANVRELIRTHYTIRRKVNLGTGPSVFYIV